MGNSSSVGAFELPCAEAQQGGSCVSQPAALSVSFLSPDCPKGNDPSKARWPLCPGLHGWITLVSTFKKRLSEELNSPIRDHGHKWAPFSQAVRAGRRHRCLGLGFRPWPLHVSMLRSVLLSSQDPSRWRTNCKSCGAIWPAQQLTPARAPTSAEADR